MNKYKVLIDLSTIMTGNSQHWGIPQDTRSLFKLMANSSDISPVGLICGSEKDSSLIGFKKYHDKVQAAYAYTDYFLKLDQTANPLESEVAGGLNPIKSFRSYLQSIRLAFKTFKKEFELYPVDTNYHDYIWRKAFDNLVDTQFKQSILEQSFVISNFSKSIQTKRDLMDLPAARLVTTGMDFALFQSAFPVSPKVSKGTIPLVRFHDTVPLRLPETLTDFSQAQIFSKSLTSSAKHAYFVCNSQPVQNDLLKLIPQLENRVFVIPPCLTVEDSPIDRNQEVIASIVKARRSPFLKKYGAVLPALKETDKYDNYILCVSTIDPRKNYPSLIRAWEQIRYQKDNQLKLIIVGSFGEKADAIIRALKPHISSGNILHLEKVPLFELGSLYAHAKAFVLPTYHEGFGCPPAEAMHAGCPVIVSDTPATRWALGEAAVFCDPYDVTSVADSLIKVLYTEASYAFREDLVQKGFQVAKQYTRKVITQQWLGLFEQLKPK